MYYIYKYTNTINGKSYIGKTKNLRKRHNSHKRANGSCPFFHAAIKKYGFHTFKRQVLKENIPNGTKANIWEIFYISHFKTLDSGYNLAPGGEGGRSAIYKEESIRQVLIDNCCHREAAEKYGIPSPYVRSLRTDPNIYPHLPRRNEYKRGFVKKLSDKDVVSILNDPRDKYVVSREYGVKLSTIDDIRLGRTWRHIPRHDAAPRKREEHNRTALTEENVKAIIADRCSHKEASEKYSVNYSTVRGIRCNSLPKWKYLDRSLAPKYEKGHT